MKSITVREAQHNLAKVLQEVASGETVEILRRKQPVARLVPIGAPAGAGKPVDWDGHERSMTAVWGGIAIEGVDDVLEDLRGGR